MAVFHAAILGIDPARLTAAALQQLDLSRRLAGATNLDVIAAGKAAAPMTVGACEVVRPRTALVITPKGTTTCCPGAAVIEAGHPFPDEQSLAGGRRALRVARGSSPGDVLLVLLSGGASALMAAPSPVTLAEKQQVTHVLMSHGGSIEELNAVRKHLSLVKGGRLAVATRGEVLTLAISDVVGDDLAVIGSGPTVADPTTFQDAVAVLERRGGTGRYPLAAVRALRRGADGDAEETPKPGDSRLARSAARVIGSRHDALAAGAAAARALGYHVQVMTDAVCGDARTAGAAHAERVARAAAALPRPLCVLSGGETTVRVIGRGKGGRNQEFAFALAAAIVQLGVTALGASIGTDGIDGPTDAAGAFADGSTFARARAAGIPEPSLYLLDNNTYSFFDRIGDLIRIGPTGTNVGDLQAILIP